jgi:predicted Zn-dependent protease
MQKNSLRIFTLLCYLLITIFPVKFAYALEGLIIRDTEIENTLKEWSQPVIKASKLNPENINFILVQNNDLNAFVAGGPNIFLYTGLLTQSENPLEVIGVISHELGHISGGHLIRTRDAFENASYESLLGMLIGIGAAIATGRGEAATAISMGSRHLAESKLLGYSRAQESSADQAALSYLDRAQINPTGLKTFLEELESQELLPASQQVEYVRTHPLARHRIDALNEGIKKSSYTDKETPLRWTDQHERMLAKLIGFITPEHVDWKYDINDNSIPAKYARAIAYYRKNEVDKALQEINSLIQLERDNPYFLELHGQMLVEFGRVEQALQPYRKSIEVLPSAHLIRTALAHALIESAGHKNKDMLSEAINHLNISIKQEPRSSRNHRLIATAYGRLNNTAMAKLHLAEEALLKREKEYARKQALSALNELKENSRAWLRAKDILTFIDNMKDKG